MALVTPTPAILSPLGIVAGGVFAQRHHTNYIRRRYGHKTCTGPQRFARDAFAAVDATWTHFTPAQKQAWRDWRYWEKTHGYNRFQRINIPRQLASLPLYLSPQEIP